MNTYSAYNLIISSELLLPELLTSPSLEAMPDVRIRFGKTPKSLGEEAFKKRSWEAKPGKFLIRIYDVANYLVLNGKEIIIERCQGSSDKDVRTFLLGTPISALLNQRGNLALHASSIQTKSGAVLFAGESGSGKSTLMTAFMQQGYPALSDDITGIMLDKTGQSFALPALPRARLWPDSLSALDIETANLQTQRQGMDKFLLPITNFCTEVLPVCAIYFLTSHNKPELQLGALKESDHLTALVRQTFRKKLVYGLGNQVQHFRIMTSLSNSVGMFQVTRSATSFLLDDMVELIEKSFS